MPPFSRSRETGKRGFVMDDSPFRHEWPDAADRIRERCRIKHFLSILAVVYHVVSCYDRTRENGRTQEHFFSWSVIPIVEFRPLAGSKNGKIRRLP